MLSDILALDPLDDGRFSARNHQESFRRSLFGGQVLAQALVAAGLTVEAQRSAHSLHAYFLRAGHTRSPVIFEVEALRDGRHVSTRLVKAQQDTHVIFTAMASFHRPETGYEHQPEVPQGSLSPETLQLHNSGFPRSVSEAIGGAEPPLEYLPFSDSLLREEALDSSVARCWTRSKDPLPDTPLLHYAALAFASDVALLGSALQRHETNLFNGRVFPASMDHSLWFHRQSDFQSWHQYITDSPWAGNARALCTGQFFDQDGHLVASVSQEGLIRPL